jgi:hypothetical protein
MSQARAFKNPILEEKLNPKGLVKVYTWRFEEIDFCLCISPKKESLVLKKMFLNSHALEAEIELHKILEKEKIDFEKTLEKIEKLKVKNKSEFEFGFFKEQKIEKNQVFWLKNNDEKYQKILEYFEGKNLRVKYFGDLKELKKEDPDLFFKIKNSLKYSEGFLNILKSE